MNEEIPPHTSAKNAPSQLHMLFTTAVDAVNPRTLVQQTVRIENANLIVEAQQQRHSFSLNGQVLVIGAGKGAGQLAQGLEHQLGDHIAAGVVVLPHGQQVELQKVKVVHGEHPFPGQGSLAAAEQITALLARRKESDLICFCLTGGASSLLVSPAPGLSLADKLAVNRQLIACGADIRAMNTVRKHLSRLKGGGLARLTHPSPLISLILSDVVGDDLSTIGSGPTVPDPTTFHDAWTIVEDFHIVDTIPAAARNYLRDGKAGLHQETPKPGDTIFTSVSNILLGSNRIALEAAAAKARVFGFIPEIVDAPLSGDTTDAALQFAKTIRAQRANIQQPLCLLAGGETTVHVTGAGKGGRNQEFALVVAQHLRDEPQWALLSAGTDGIDGPTDAAGAFVDGDSMNRAQEKELDPQHALYDNDSYTFFSALGDLFRPGQTGTNVMDIKIALLWPSSFSTTRSLAKS